MNDEHNQNNILKVCSVYLLSFLVFLIAVMAFYRGMFKTRQIKNNDEMSKVEEVQIGKLPILFDKSDESLYNESDYLTIQIEKFYNNQTFYNINYNEIAYKSKVIQTELAKYIQRKD